MIVAIIQQLGGIVPVTEFREAVDEATAVNDYCNGFNPPLAPGNYYGFNTGWLQFQYPVYTNRWAFDFSTLALVQVPLPTTFELKASVKVIDQQLLLVSDVFGDLGGVVAALSLLLTEDLTKLYIRATGMYRSIGNGNVLRICENGSPISLEYPLVDNGGVFQPFFFTSNVAPSASLNLYTLQGALGNLSNTFELKYVTFNLILLQS